MTAKTKDELIKLIEEQDEITESYEQNYGSEVRLTNNHSEPAALRRQSIYASARLRDELEERFGIWDI